VATHAQWLIEHLRATLAFGYELPARYLDIVGEPLTASAVAAAVAQACFGDAGLVYDVTARLTTPGMHDGIAALIGASPGYLPLPGESLVRFIESRGRGVIVIDDAQAFSPDVLATLAEMADSGRAPRDGTTASTVPTQQCIFLAFARLAVPSPRALVQRAGRDAAWPIDDRPPANFRDILEHVASECDPAHFPASVISRFEGIDAGFAWERYCELLTRNELDTPMFAEPRDVAMPTAPPQPRTRNVLQDVDAIPIVPDDREPYDAFISYSWSRTEDGASWLRDELRRLGLRVFFDKDELTLAGVADDQVKTVLIQKLRAIVSRSRAWVVFAAALAPYAHDSTITDAQALTRGIAMDVNDVIVEWNWQAFEMRYMGSRLVVGGAAAYVVGGDGNWDPSFGTRPIEDRQDMLTHVLQYLEQRGIVP